MSENKSTSIENRRDPRYELDRQVTLEFAAGAIVGPGENISQQGVFFTTDGKLPVTVRIAGTDVAVQGELVRYEAMGDGRVGIAVRFAAPEPDLLGTPDAGGGAGVA
ncbi:MAG: PilZ domain-containing protein [Planctomycetes bacterium]|nr:PilZ domain-containing protein [Planctomycetota bacterium]